MNDEKITALGIRLAQAATHLERVDIAADLLAAHHQHTEALWRTWERKAKECIAKVEAESENRKALRVEVSEHTEVFKQIDEALVKFYLTCLLSGQRSLARWTRAWAIHLYTEIFKYLNYAVEEDEEMVSRVKGVESDWAKTQELKLRYDAAVAEKENVQQLVQTLLSQSR